MPYEPSPFRLPAAARAAMASCVEAEFPDEACGFCFAGGPDLVVVPMENIQNRLHREDPVRHVRDARTAYEIDPQEWQRVVSDHEQAGRPLRAVFHSHPNESSYFSPTDSDAAAPFGEPSFPGVVFLVFSVREGKVADLKAFDWSDAAGKYIETPIVTA